MLSTKKCSRCKQVLPIDSFCKHRKRKDGHGDWCKDCARAYFVNRYHTNPVFRKRQLGYIAKYNEKLPKSKRNEYIRKSMKQYRQTHKVKLRESKKIGEFLSTSGLREQLLKRANGVCELCPTKLNFTEKQHNYNIHHVDGNRYNNSIENLIVVCTRCHLHKLHPRPRKVYAI